MFNNISAIIPVKANSSRLPNKNILPFGDSNLLINKINHLKHVIGLKEIIVSSDSDVMLKIAKENGVIAIKRPDDLADESRPFSDFLDYICTIMQGEHLMWSCCTSPFVDSILFNKAIELYYEKLNEGYDSLITVAQFQHFLLDENGPMNFKMGKNHCNSQDLPMFHSFTNGIILSPKESIEKWHYHFGPNAYRLLVDQKQAIDIDTEYDYIFAKSLYDIEKIEAKK